MMLYTVQQDKDHVDVVQCSHSRMTKKQKSDMICFRTHKPNYDGVNVKKHNQSNTSYSNGTKDIPTDAQQPRETYTYGPTILGFETQKRSSYF